MSAAPSLFIRAIVLRIDCARCLPTSSLPSRLDKHAISQARISARSFVFRCLQSTAPYSSPIVFLRILPSYLSLSPTLSLSSSSPYHFSIYSNSTSPSTSFLVLLFIFSHSLYCCSPISFLIHSTNSLRPFFHRIYPSSFLLIPPNNSPPSILHGIHPPSPFPIPSSITSATHSSIPSKFSHLVQPDSPRHNVASVLLCPSLFHLHEIHPSTSARTWS